jgi:hypothetical protein
MSFEKAIQSYHLYGHLHKNLHLGNICMFVALLP